MQNSVRKNNINLERELKDLVSMNRFSSGSSLLSTIKPQSLLSTIKQQKHTTGKRGHITTTALKQSAYKEQEYTLSIIENYAREVGICAFNFRTMEIFITQFIDNEAYVNTITMINYWRPLEIVMNQRSEGSSLHLMIKSIFLNCYVGFLPRKNFNEDMGKNIYSKSTVKELSIEEINMKYVCMASLSGLINYLESNPNYEKTNEYIIKYHYLENHLNISFNSTLDLELLVNKKDKRVYSSLYSLFTCRTISGCRLLRSNILQPLATETDIFKRYEAVDELVHNNEILSFIKANIPLFKEIEIFISKLMLKNDQPSENVLRQILISVEGIRKCVKLLPQFNEGLKGLKSEIFQNIFNFLNEKVFEEISENIDIIIEDFDYGENLKINRRQDSIFFLIKEGVNNVLDVSRKTYMATVNEIYAEFENIKAATNDPNMKLCYNENKGYYVVVGEKYFNKNNFAIYKKNGKKYSCSNIALISFSERIREIKSELIMLSITNMENTIRLLRKKINYLYVLSSHIALIDLICAFADYATNGTKTVCPEILNKTVKTEFTAIYGKNCLHPILSKLPQYNFSSNNFMVPNDYFFINNFNLLLLKGPNASGKTTYMKQIALLVILAQIGCFVPCDYFVYSLRNFIYTRFDNNDSIEENRGTFVKQIIEIQKVLTSNYKNALILLDEPFDNSNAFDIFAIAISFLDLLTTKADGSFMIISSHNNLISNLGEFYFNAVIGSMVVEFRESDLNFLYKFKFNSLLTSNEVKEKKIKESNYGIILAEMIGYDKEIIEYSKEISKGEFDQININDYVDKSDNANVLKMFLLRLFLYIFEIMCSKKTFTIEEEIKTKMKKLNLYINSSILK